MTNTLTVSDWLDQLNNEYLTSFVSSGGATVKFVVTNDDTVPSLHHALKARCGEQDYLFFAIDSAQCPVHMPQEIFFSIAQQIDWRPLTRRFILNLLSKRYNIDGINPLNSGVIAEVATANGIDREFLSLAWQPMLQDAVTKNRNMVKAFRIAMTHLCLMEVNPQPTGTYPGQPLLDWLTGRDKRIGNIKPFSIRTSINRATARYFIKALSHWIHHSGYSGMVIFLDNSRVTLARNPRDGNKFYSRPMTIDHYQLLRDFIDEVDTLSATALVVRTGYDFLDENSKRSWHIYTALQTRIMDEVRDENIVNPASSLVRLKSGAC